MLFDFPRGLLLLKAGTGRLVEDTATGNPLTFNTNVAKPLKSLLIPFTPTQTGTGDPSPDNVRPIVGLTGLTVYHAGKNLFDVSSYPFTTSRRISGADGTVGSNSSFKATLDFIPCDDFAGKTVTLNKRCGGNAPGIGFYSSADESAFVGGAKNEGASAGIPWTFVVPSDAKFMRFTVSADYATDIQIEFGSQSTAYEPYKPITETEIPFPSPVYGGTLDLVSGVLTVTHAIYSPTGSEAGCQAVSGGRIAFVCPREYRVNGYYLSSHFNTVQIASSYIYITTAMTATELEEYFENNTVQIAVELATPRTIQLDPVTVNALVGDNTVWSDTNGENTAVYLKKA